MFENLFFGTHLVSATIIFIFFSLLLKLSSIKSRWVWNPIFCASVLAYSLRVLTTDSFPILAELLNLIEFLAPILFIICIRANFQEPFSIGLIEKAAFTVLLPILVLSKTLNVTNDFSEGLFSWLLWTPYFISLICVFAAFWVAIKDWNTDLVDKRRLLRRILVFGFSPLIVIALSLHALALIYPVDAPGYKATIALIYGLSAYGLILIGGYLEPDWLGDIGGSDNPEPSSESSNAEGKIENVVERNDTGNIQPESNAMEDLYVEELKALDDVMAKQKYYRQTGLTIAQLAGYLGQPEYRLRKAINQGLGFRNFKSFLNKYRVYDAAEQLRQNKQTKSILNISIDAGFNGLSTFNRAFKDHFGETPSEFRSKTDKL